MADQSRSVRRALVLSFIGNYATVGLQLITVIIISRLLTPAEVGIYSIAAAFVAIASVVRDFGVAEYLMISRELTAERIRVAFTLNLLVSWLAAATIWLCREPIASFYGIAGVSEAISVLAWNFVLIPFGAVTMAYLRREMRMEPILYASLASSLVTNIVAITLAYLGFSYMALVWGSFAGVVVNVAIARFYRPNWFPTWPGLTGIREAASAGFKLSIVYIGGQLGKSAPDLIIGRILGSEAVGIFSRASGLLDVFGRTVTATVSRVALPYFAAKDRNTGDASSGFYRSIEYLTGIGWLYFAALSAGASLFVPLLFGPKWAAVAGILSVLAASQAIDTTFAMAREYLISRNALGSSANVQLVTLLVNVVACFAAAPFGLLVLAWAMTLASVCNLLINYLFLRRYAAVELRLLLASVKKSAAASFLALCAWIPASWALVQWDIGLLAKTILFGMMVVLSTWPALAVVRHPLSSEVWQVLVRLNGQFLRRKGQQR